MAAIPSANGFSRSTLTSPNALLPASSAAARQSSKPGSTPSRQPKSPALGPAMQTDTNIAAHHARDRLLYLLAAFVGQQATLTLNTNDRYTGIFSAASFEGPEKCYVLKMTKRTSSASTELSNGANTSTSEYVGYGDDHVMTFDIKDVACVEAVAVVTDKVQSKLPNGSSFRTDADISGNLEVRERQLEAWQDTSLPSADLSMTTGGVGNWDQFAENEKRFGLTTDYDETMYTTPIDRSHASYKARAMRADIIARSIENEEATNSHVAEERNFILPEAENMDEESKFSGVARNVTPLASSNPNRYMPPAKRPPTSAATVAGAPVDPAIISASLARPDSSKQTAAQNASPSRTVTKDTEISTASTSTSVALPQVASQILSAATATSCATESKPVVPSPRGGKMPGSSGGFNATANVEHDVSHAFKQWSAEERKNLEAARKAHALDKLDRQKKDRANNIADLKKFSANFTLKTFPPQDILGILARDKAKQQEIGRKAEEQRKLLATTQAASVVAATTSPPAPVQTPTGISAERGPQKSGRNAQGVPQQQQFNTNNRNNQTNGNVPAAPRVTGQLGQRLLAHQQSNGRGFPNGPYQPPMDAGNLPPQPVPVNTDFANNRRSSVASARSVVSPFNVKAMEFKPNPAASAFQPGDARKGQPSPARVRAISSVNKERPINRVSFFGNKKPEAGKKKSIREGFNPIERMQKEVAASEKATKDCAANGGIPKAFTTRLSWDNGLEVEGVDKGYIAMATKGAPAAAVTPAGPFPSATPHPIPPQAHQPYFNAQRTPSFRGHGREYFDDRIHPGSQHSSVHPSPSMRPQMLAPQMGMQQHLSHHMMYNQQQQGGRPYSNYMSPSQQYAAPPMMASHSNQGHFMPMIPQGQNMPIYPPNGYPMQAPQQMPGNMYGSPRQAQMMMHSGSNHAQMAPQFIPGGPGFMPNPQQMNMRGPSNYPYGNPQMQPNRGQNQFGGGSFPQQPPMMPQQMHPVQMMGHHPGAPMRYPSDHSETK